MENTLSFIQRIELDLTLAHTDARYTVRAKQVFYDIGEDSAKTGYITVKLNSIQSGSISLSPGGWINHEDIQEIFISNPAQPGKRVVLLASFDATVNTPPNNPLTAGIPKTIDFVAMDGYTLVTDYGIGAAFVQNIIDQVTNVSGVMVHKLDVSIRTLDFRDIIQFYIYDVAPINRFIAASGGGNGGNSRFSIEYLYLRPGTGLVFRSRSSSGGVEGTGFVQPVALSVVAVWEYL